MTMSATSTPGLAHRQTVAVLALVAVVVALIASTAWFVGELLDRSNAVATLRERLAQAQLER